MRNLVCRRTGISILLALTSLLIASCSSGGQTEQPKGGTTVPAKTPTPVERDSGAIVHQEESPLIPGQAIELALPDGATLSVPANTVDSDATLRLTRSQAPSALKGKEVLSDVYYVESMNRPRAQGEFTLSIPYDRSKLPQGVSEGDLQGYGIVDGDILFPAASRVDRTRQVVEFQEPEVTVLDAPSGFKVGDGTGSGALSVGYAIGPASAGELLPACESGKRGEVHQQPGHDFTIILLVDAECSLVEFVSTTLQEVLEVYNHEFPKRNGARPFAHLSPDNRMKVYMGNYDGVNGEYKLFSWNGYVEIDVDAANADRKGLREVLYHEMFHAVQDVFSNMFIAGNAAKWWYEATAAWTEMRYAGKTFGDAVNEYLGTYPEFMSIHITQSGDEGRTHYYPYSLLIRHIEQVKPGYVLDMLRSSMVDSDAFYKALVEAGDLPNTYGDFVREMLVQGLVQSRFWNEYGFFERDAELIFREPVSRRIGEREYQMTEISEEPRRYSELKVRVTALPMATGFVNVASVPNLPEPRTVKVALLDGGKPTTNAWIARTSSTGTSPSLTRMASGTKMEFPGLGDSYNGLWVAAFNPDPYVTKVYEVSIQLEKKEEPKSYQGTIVMGSNDRFPPRAFAISGTGISPAPDAVKAFLDTGYYDESFSFFQLDCDVQVQSFEGAGTYDADAGTIKGWYELAYEYTGANAASCREMLGTLLDDTAIMLGRKPAFGGGRVEFSGQIDSRGYGTVSFSFSDGTSGDLDVAPDQ